MHSNQNEMNYKKIFKIILISLYFYPEPGGGAAAALNRAIMLKKIGYKVYVICSFPSYPSGKVVDEKYRNKFFQLEEYHGINLIRLKVISIKHEGYLKRLIIFINFSLLCFIYFPKIIFYTKRIDIVYSFTPIFFSSFIGFIYSNLLNSFFIYDVTDLWPEELVVFKTSFSSLITFLGKRIAKLTYITPNLIITISKSSAEIIRNNYHIQIPIYVLPLGVDTEQFIILDKNECRQKLIQDKIFQSSFQNKFIILYTGIISRAQKLTSLIDLAAKMEDEQDILFLIIGEGEEKTKIEQMILKMNNVKILPYQPKKQIPYIINSADLCAVTLSSEPIFQIAIPTKFYEYISCRKPIIGICHGELKNIINSNGIGCAKTPEEVSHIIPFINDIKKSGINKKLEENIDATVKKLSLDSLAMELESILKDIPIGKI